jgi:NAD(P)-dependent dehydrogenase (short-subunit alcohol dehydrogenase family)
MKIGVSFALLQGSCWPARSAARHFLSAHPRSAPEPPRPEPRPAGRNRPVFFLTRAAWPYLKDNHGGGANTASLNGLMSFKTLGSLAHTTAKAGIIGMTRQLAMEGREHGIRANSISPGLIETNQTREQLKDPEWASAMLGETLLDVSAGSRKWRTSLCSWPPMTVRTSPESISSSMAE